MHWTASLFALLAAACNFGAPRSRYVLKTDPGSRHNFQFVKDTQTGQWVQLHCELRVSEQRPMPSLVHTAEHGDLLSFTYFAPGSMGSAGVDPAAYARRDGFRVWLWRERALKENFEGKSALAVQAKWPTLVGKPANFEAMEVFNLPPLESLVPYVWSPWRKADQLSGGIFAGWEKLQGVGAGTAADGTRLPPEKGTASPFPYELRCRVVLTDSLLVPIEAEDPNIARPDPSAATRPTRSP